MSPLLNQVSPLPCVSMRANAPPLGSSVQVAKTNLQHGCDVLEADACNGHRLSEIMEARQSTAREMSACSYEQGGGRPPAAAELVGHAKAAVHA